MIPQSEFQPLLEDSVTAITRKLRPEQRVIKQKDVKLNKPIKIDIDESGSENSSAESIEPIIEDDCAVGVIHRCICGNSTEIRFDYETNN